MSRQHTFEPIAIVGLGAIMPDAPDATTFWRNITSGRYSIADVPPERWDPELYYDPDPHAVDKTYSKIGGWVREFGWDPIAWRLPVPPRVAEQLDQGQKWAVSAAREALIDAGWPGWGVDPERVAVILGNALGGEKHYASNQRIELPESLRALRAAPSFAALPEGVRDSIVAETRKAFLARSFEITEDTMPGELANVIAGRVANLFNFRGPNFTTDAACASGLAAIWSAASGLASRQYDAVVTGGVDRNMGVAAFVKFCKIGALSATGTRPFDAGADGFVMGEGAALFVLKRLADAEAAGDRIYAVLLGVAGSSDGKGKGITAPNSAGQRLAVEGAWRMAGVDPATATAVEAHGTSTRVGDAAELDTLTGVFGAAPAGGIALGSVKSNIGHLKAAAGAAGLFKMVRSLHEGVLPPSLHFADPNPAVDWAHSPFRVVTELREWPAPRDGVRRAGVSAFGFGGTNFHAVLEGYVPGRHRDGAQASFAGADLPKTQVTAAASAPVSEEQDARRNPRVTAGPLRGALVVGGETDAAIAEQLRWVQGEAAAGRAPAPAAPDPVLAGAAVRVAIDYADAAELAAKAGRALSALSSGNAAMWRMLRAQGVFLGRGPAPKVAFLYTGQGSQYVDMLRELRELEPVVAETFTEADRIMTPILGRPLSSYIFTGGADRETLARGLTQTEITQPAILTVDVALTRMLAERGVEPDMLMGHSLGEYGALVAAGALEFPAALEAVSARGREMANLEVPDKGAMAAVFAPLSDIERIVAQAGGDVVIANVNSTSQAVVGGATLAVEEAVQRFGEAGFTAQRIPVSHAFHTSIVAPASEPLRATLRRLDVHAPRRPVVANVNGQFYPAAADGDTMVDILGRQVASPVQFVTGLRTLYNAGARVFVEVGPKKALHGFVEDVLGDDVTALFTNHPKVGDIASFNQAMCGLYAAGLGLGARADAPAPPSTEPRVDMDTQRQLELGRLFVEFLERGRQIYGGLPASEPVAITGAALGLPGVERVFDDDNVGRILDGEQFIDAIPHRFRRALVEMNITRLVKRDSGDPTFETIDDEAHVVKLAGRHAPFDVVATFGVEESRDAAFDDVTRLAVGAGFDALRDAGIPLVMHYRTTTLGTKLPDRWGLPEQMRDDTGIVFASAFPGYNAFAHDIEQYLTDRGRREQLAALEAVRSRMRGDESAVAETDRRIAQLRHRIDTEPFAFDRRFLFRCLAMAHSQFAELIGARGPNTQVNAACASTTQALGVAEDWIRTGRCRRVIVIAADDATNDVLLPWITAGFLASGAAATDEAVQDAAVPFDRRRHGMIVGMGAAAFVVEAADAARERGIRPICEVLGSVAANSAYHGTRLDVPHIGQVMERLMRQAETRGVDRRSIARSTMFVSHETYTPARGGSAQAEINALRSVFGEHADEIVITNTKGFTGHAMGAGIEDVVAIKALETGIVPPVANFREPDPELGELNLSKGGAYPVDYALRLAAGFGSQIAMSLLRWTPMPDRVRRSPDQLGFRYRIVDEDAWRRWLAAASGHADPELEVVTRRLRVVDAGPSTAAPKAAVARAGAPGPARATAEPVVAEPVVAEPVVAEPVVAEPVVAEPVVAEPVVAEPVVAEPVVAEPVVAEPVVAEPVVAEPVVAEPAVPEPVVAASVSPVVEPAVAVPAVDGVTSAVVSVVAELTGYPAELLDLDLDLEADLGVDTVKQAEVFAAVRQRFGIERDETLQLRDFPTLAHVIGWVRERTGTAAPEPTPATAVQTEPAAPDVPAVDEVTSAVVSVVAELTGYPAELLDLDLDLEADLGVDTVKQAEVFAAVRQRFGIERDETLQLRDFPTLAHVIGWVRERTGPAAPEPAPQVVASASPPGTAVTAEDAARFPRRVPVPVLRPALEQCTPTGVTLAGARVVVMLDEGGIGRALVNRLEKAGATALTLDPGVAVAEVRTRLDGWLAEGPVAGVYWLSALDDEGPFAAMDLDDWREALRRRVKNLYAAMRRLVERPPFLVVATRFGGHHGYDEAGATAPLGGAVRGFAKAYHREQPDTLVKVVDFPAGRRTAALADTLVAETLRDRGCVEAGHVEGLRFAVGLVERPFGDGTGGTRLGPDSTVVVSGAAGSIVSAIVADLAAAAGGATFHLLDLASEPDAADPDLRRFATDRDGLKDDLADRLKAAGERPTPMRIEKELAALERRAAALAAVQAVRAAGGTARYHSVDLTDACAVARVFDEVRASSGKIDLLLHAAGVDTSRALAAKEPREYDAVFDVKADGWFTLLHAAGELPIGAIVAFGSVAGRFGNAGQTDYAAANDLLATLTSNLRRSRPDIRAIVLDWTAWGGIGMATRGSVPTVMAAAGIETLAPEVGVPWIRRELGSSDQRGEVVVAGAMGRLIEESDPTGGLDPATVATGAAGPMIGTAVSAGVYSGLVVRTTLDPTRQPFLDDHRIDGTAVLPGVMGVEGFAELARLLAPGLHVTAVEGVRFRAPVKFYGDEPRTLTLRAVLRHDGADLVADCAVEAERVLPGSAEPQRTTHFTGSVRLAAAPPTPEREETVVQDGPAVGAADVYRLYFHGPAYRVVDAAWGYDGGDAARLAEPLPPNHLPADLPTVTGPRLVELCFQAAGLVDVARHARMALPASVDRVSVLRDPASVAGPLYAVAVEHDDHYDCSVRDASGDVVVRVLGYRATALPGPVTDELRRPFAEALDR